MSRKPNVAVRNGEIQFEFCDVADEGSEHVVECVLDFSLLGEVVGVEILALRAQAGIGCLDQIEGSVATSGSGLRYSYDDVADAFYLQISAEASSDQVVVDGVLVLNEEGAIVGLRAAVS